MSAQDISQSADAATASPLRGAKDLLRAPPAVCRLLLALLDAAPHSLSKDECLDVLSGKYTLTTPLVVKVQVCRLRSALRWSKLPQPTTSHEGYGFDLSSAERVRAAIQAATARAA